MLRLGHRQRSPSFAGILLLTVGLSMAISLAPRSAAADYRLRPQ
jgi:hypothetical protein